MVLAVVALTTTFGFWNLIRASGPVRTRLAAGELSGVFALARSAAIRYKQNVGVKFFVEADGTVSYGLFKDDDGDGVSSRDIEDGTDLPLTPRRDLEHLGHRTGFGFPPGDAPRDPADRSRRLDRLDDPIRFNNSDIASFSPLGGATPGSVYVTDGRDSLSVVRILGRTGRIRTLRYDSETESWR